MIKVLISGACGKMGVKVAQAAENFSDVKIVCGVDKFINKADFPIYSDFSEISEDIDVVIDFSSPQNLTSLIEFVKRRKCGAVLCTTGYTTADAALIKEISKEVPLFRSANMSVGVNLLSELVKKAAEALKGFDAEIIEMHHGEKIDAPSGTALMLADAIKDVLPDRFYVYGRSGKVGKRDKNEIGIHALRGGNVVGEHSVIFAGQDETITLSHSATDRKVFAQGAIKAAIYISGKENGLYDMSDMINGR